MKQFTKWAAGVFAGVSAALLAAGVIGAFGSSSTPSKATMKRASAKATISGPGGISGTVNFQQTGSGPLSPVQVTATIKGLTNGLHGMHIHEVGNCTPATGAAANLFTNAGGHYDPGPASQSALTNHPWHSGDLQALNSTGGIAIQVYLSANRFTLDNGPSGLFDGNGSAVVIHAGADAYAPGAAGGTRVACGVVQ